LKSLRVEIVLLTGDTDIINRTAAENNISCTALTLFDTKAVIDIHDEPTMVIKEKSDCSMAVAVKGSCRG
jgi:fatty acid/phospholipid biosynthesis enzyme